MRFQTVTSLQPRFRNGTLEIPVAVMRGGTSTGIVVEAAHLPADRALQEEVLREVMGSPTLTLAQQASAEVLKQNLQITGFGRGVPTSNKCFIVQPSQRPGCDIESTLAQLANNTASVDWRVNCGNFSSALPLFALERGWVQAKAGANRVGIWNHNTELQLDTSMLLDDAGRYALAEIDGVLGCGPNVLMTLFKPVGAETGKLLPSGAAVDEVGGMHCSLVDVAVPMVIFLASEWGGTLEAVLERFKREPAHWAQFQQTWQRAALKLGLRDSSGRLLTEAEIAKSETMPKVCLVDRPTDSRAHLRVQYFTPQRPHSSLAVSGGTCIAAAALIEGGVAQAVLAMAPTVVPADSAAGARRMLTLQHPAGVMNVYLDFASAVLAPADIMAASYERSAQWLTYGHMPLYQASERVLEVYTTRLSSCEN